MRLSASSIKDSQECNLKGYWKFNEGRGAVALDSSGKGNPGSIVNTPGWVTDTPK